MNTERRLQRLEEFRDERELRRQAARVAERLDVPVEAVLEQLRGVVERVQRWGIDEEIRRIATLHGVSEDEMWARYEDIVARMQDES